MQEALAIARMHYDAFNMHEVERAAAIIADDVEWVNVPFGHTLHGVEGYRQHLWIWHRAFPDGSVEIVDQYADGEHVTTEFIGRGTHTGVFASPVGELAPTGRRVEVAFCEVMRVRDGRIAFSRLYFDAVTMLGQLGVIPALGSAGAWVGR